MTDNDLHRQALEKWGLEGQMNMVTEECSELIKAISHMRRGRCGWDHVAEEIADVEITISSIKCHIENVAGKELLENEKAKKMERLEKRLEN